MKRLGSILEDAGVIDEIQLVRALSHQRKWHCRLGKSLIDLGFVDENAIAKALSTQLDVPYHELDPSQTPAKLLGLVPKNIAMERHVFPVKFGPCAEGKGIVLAMSDPSDKEVMSELERTTGYRIEPVVSKDSLIEDAVNLWDKYAASNPESSPESQIASAHQEMAPPEATTSEALHEGEIIEDAQPVDEEPPVSVQEEAPTTESEPEFDRGVPNPLPSAPVAGHERVSFDSGESTDEDIAEMPDLDELLTASDLPPIDDDDEEESAPEIVSSQPGERSMPGVDVAADVKPERDAEPPAAIEVDDTETAEINHAEPWEHIMPGVDAAADIQPERDAEPSAAIEVDDTEAAEINHAEPWEHTMPGVDAAAEQVAEVLEGEFAMDDRHMVPADYVSEKAPSPFPSPPPPVQTTELPTESDEDLTVEQLSAQVKDLSSQVSLLRRQMGILKEAVAKLKKGESN